MSGWGYLRGRRLWGRRGWGGVAAMAGVCALALAGTLMPLGDAPRPGPQPPVHVVRAQYADAPQDEHDDNCDRSLNPSSGPQDGAALQRIRQRGRLVVGVDQNSYLWGFRDPASGQLAGFDIELATAIARSIFPGKQDPVQFLTVPTDQRIPLVQSGKVDMVIRTMTINCKRVGQVSFSQPYFTAGQQILVPKTSPITGFDATLKGRTVCTAKGSTGEAKLDATPLGEKVVTVGNQLDCLVQLQLGLVDAVFTDNALAAGQAAQDPSVHLVGGPVTVEPYGVAMKLGADDLVRKVNAVLNAYTAGGAGSAWMRSYDRWLADKLPDQSPPVPAYKQG